jgi:hypothetical protein
MAAEPDWPPPGEPGDLACSVGPIWLDLPIPYWPTDAAERALSERGHAAGTDSDDSPATTKDRR